jgi:2-polyprenyl-6-methoxyphenol hydroxylase-like FAD-dependent oxidoreductase
VTVELEDGRKLEGDLLVGADGIWSKVRKCIPLRFHSHDFCAALLTVLFYSPGHTQHGNNLLLVETLEYGHF